MDERTTAWYALHVNTIDDAGDVLTITGIATTPEPDRRGDIIDPLGATYAAEIPLLLHHDKERPVGVAVLGVATPAGIPFTAWLRSVAGPAALRERIEEAKASIVAGLLKGISIGYRAIAPWVKPLASGGLLFTRSEIIELSLVTVPSNPSAGITGIKALDLAASGRYRSAVADDSKDPSIMQTIQERMTHWQGLRGPLVQQMTDMMTAQRATPLGAEEQKTYDGMAGRLVEIDGEISRLSVLERANAAAAVPITVIPAVPSSTAPPLPSATRPYITVKAVDLPKGTSFVRACMCLARGKGDGYQAQQFARAYENTPDVELIVKAAVAPGTTTDPAWAGALVQVQMAIGEFIELLRPATILGKMPVGGSNGLRKVPFNTSVPSQTAGGSYGWVGQNAPKPVTKLAFGTAYLPVTKAAGIIILTDELAKLSTPSAEDLVRNDMRAGIAQFLDQQLIDPAVVEVPNISPASLTNGIAPITSTQNPIADLHAILSAFAADNVSLGSITVIMSETNAFTLGWQRDALGMQLFPGVGVNGGNVQGFSIITSNTAADKVIGVAAPLVLLADDGQVTVDVSREATVQMDSGPANPADATTVMTSLWQNNLVGLRAERFINWKRVTPKAVHWVSGAAYTPAIAAPASGQTAAARARVEPTRETGGAK